MRKSFGRRSVVWLLGLLILATAVSPVMAADADEYEHEVASLQAGLNQAVSAYENGNAVEAAAAVKQLFFDFESSHFDQQLAVTDKELYVDLERGFLMLGQSIGDVDASEQVVRAQVATVQNLLGRALKTVQSGGAAGGAVFTQSLLIILREGLEALLILSAMIASLLKMGYRRATRLIYGGAAGALVASAILSVFAGQVLASIPGSRALVEAVTMLLAVGVLFYVSFWLVSKAEARRWQQFIHTQVEKALSSKRQVTLAGVAFLAVFREGIETILFYQALTASAAGNLLPVTVGAAAGGLILAAAWWVITRWGLRLPIRPFFMVTGGFLYFMAFRFAGQAVLELQEAGWPIRHVPFVPEVSFLENWFAIYPYAESLLLQGFLVLALVAGLIYVALKTHSHRTPTAQS